MLGLDLSRVITVTHVRQEMCRPSCLTLSLSCVARRHALVAYCHVLLGSKSAYKEGMLSTLNLEDDPAGAGQANAGDDLLDLMDRAG
eukprot:scaffold241230_cov17-Tisochrysis_lutea.AAC.1